MTVRSLTQGQQQSIDALVTSGALQGVPPDLAKAARFLEQASEALGEVVDLRVPSVIYDIAYNAAHDVGEAMLAAYGYRTASGAGQHVAVGQFLEAVFDGPPAGCCAQVRPDPFGAQRPSLPRATRREGHCGPRSRRRPWAPRRC